jgi:hypothetical protein
MSMFKRLINVITILWGLWFVFMVIVITISDETLTIGEMFDNEPELSAIFFFGWLIILFVNYILFKKVTLWNK